VSPASVDLLSFRRAFVLLLLLVVLPACGLAAFGVVAIVNERAAVEKRLSDAWRGRLGTLAHALVERLDGALTARGDAPVFDGIPPGIEGTRFWIQGDAVEAPDDRLTAALEHIRADLEGLPERPLMFSVPDVRGTFLVAALRRGPVVRGVALEPDGLSKLAEELAREVAGGEGAHFELKPLQAGRETPEGLISRFVVQVTQAREALESRPLAEAVLPPPLQAFKLIALPVGEDPVVLTSARNRALYGVLLGVLYGLLGVGVALTARTLYREARLSRLKTDFVSLVSHELRTPLTSIRVFIETLSLGRVKDPAQVQEVLGLLTKETERLSEMIEHVLDWARIEGGHKSYHRENVSVDSVVEASVAAFRAQHHASAVDFACELAAGLPRVEVDKDAVAGALLNLMQNAFKYGGEPKRVRVRTRPESNGVAIDVEDNGTGIPTRERKRIFERFYRIDNLLTRQTEGSGLGLAISKRIVEAQGGRISIKSELGHGSCFTIHLPPARRATA